MLQQSLPLSIGLQVAMKWALLDDGSSPRLPSDLVADRNPSLITRILSTVAATVCVAWYLLPSELVNGSNATVFCAVSVAVICPIYWNCASRLEYRTLIWTRVLGGNRTLALYVFSFTILALSTAREAAFKAVVDAGLELGPPILKSEALVKALERTGILVVAAGVVISMAAYIQLGFKGTYMGEAFGFFCPALITTFPFSWVDDPMYLGSTLMHFGVAMQVNSLVALFVSVVVGESYWIAACVFERPFSAQVYALQAKINAAKSSKDE